MPDWLVNAVQGERVCRVLTHSIPEFASGTLILQKCRAKHMLLSNAGTGWTGTYHLTIAEPTARQPHIVSLLGTLIPRDQAAADQARTAVPFGSDGWRWYVPELHLAFQTHPPETQLAALAELADPEKARTFLEQSIQANAPAYRELRIESCRPQVLRYHPGLRCTIGYHLTYASDLAAGHNWPAFVVAKTYDGDKGQLAYDSMQALWASSLGTSGAVRIAEPLAYVPELKLLLQGPIPGEQTLQGLLETTLDVHTPEALADLDDYLHKTAVGLAELHNAGVGIGNPHSWEDELTGVRAFVQRLTARVPELAGAATSLFTCLESLGTTCPPDSSVPTHGTFRPSQVLLDDGQIGFIDFDSFCQAEPAMDLALFMVTTIDRGMNAVHTEQRGTADIPLDTVSLDRLTKLESITETFLAYYARLRPVSRSRVALWEALNILELMARCWERVKPARLNHIIPMLERRLHAQLISRISEQ
jgi:hypothetical protein